MTRSRRRLAAAAAVTALGLSGFTGTALADPVAGQPGTYPQGWTDPTIFAGVGSDASDKIYQHISEVYDAQNPAPSELLASYDATNPVTGATNETIQTKPGCSLTRPSGANSGASALVAGNVAQAAQGGDGTTPCIDFARLSRPRNTSTESSLQFYALSRDAVDWVTVGTSYAPRTPLTTTQLKAIFQCQVTDWSEVGGQPGAIHVYVPPASAGTYTFFLTVIGSSVQAVTDGCGSSATVIQQNDGTRMNADPQAVIPYAVTKWAGQANGAPETPDYRGGTVLGHINDSTEPLSTATLNNVTYQVLSDGFGTGVAGRLLYTALRTTAPAHLVDIFKSGGFVCSQQSELLIPFGATPLGNDTTASRYCGQVS